MDSQVFTTFLPSLGEKKREGPLFSEANFGVGTNSRLIALNARCLVRKRTKIDTLFENTKHS
mgnify:CR=1 FL=1